MSTPTTLTEAEEAKKLMQWVSMHPLLRRFMIHIPNEGKRSWWLGKHLKAIGVKSGVSDYFIPIPTYSSRTEPKQTISHGLWIELKRTKRYAISNVQKQWIEDMRTLGYSAEFAFGADDAIAILQDYLKYSHAV